MIQILKNIYSSFKKYDLSSASPEFTQEILKEYNSKRPLGPQDKMCYAPFKNLYFGHFGKATACCYNRNFVLGTYPKNSIKEIWFGAKTNKLRKHISENNFEYGCLACKNHILAKNFDANKSKQYDNLTLNKNNYPSVLELELSNVCNLECEMCNGNFSSSIRKNREKLPPIKSVYDSNFLEELREFIPYLEEIKFYGGEPFLIDIYYEIWEMVIEIKPTIRLSVQTNATVLNTRIKNILNKGNFHLNISIDSLDTNTYQTIRKNANFDKVIKNLMWFIDYSKSKKNFIGISACLLKQNWKEMPDFITFCIKHQVQIYFHFVYSPIAPSIASFDKKAILHLYNKLSSYNFSTISDLDKKNVQHYIDLLKQIKYFSNKSLQKNILTISSIEEYMLYINSIIKNSDFSSKEKKAISNQIKLNLNRVYLLSQDKNDFLKTLKPNTDYSNLLLLEQLLEIQDLSDKELKLLLNQLK